MGYAPLPTLKLFLLLLEKVAVGRLLVFELLEDLVPPLKVALGPLGLGERSFSP